MPLRQTVPEASTNHDDDRREARRLKAQDVPWITGVQAGGGGNARLVDISCTGALLDSTARLLPGRQTTITLTTADRPSQRIRGIVVRTQLVGMAAGGGPLYRTAVTFDEKVDLQSLGAQPASAPQSAALEEPQCDVGPGHKAGPSIDGPLDGLLATESGSEPVAVSSVTETGCFVSTAVPVELGDRVAICVYLSHVRRLQMTGTVARLVRGVGCGLRFTNQTAEDRRTLRVEIVGHASSQLGKTQAADRVETLGTAPRLVLGAVHALYPPIEVSLRDSQW